MHHGNVGEALNKGSIGWIVKHLVRCARHSLGAGFVTKASTNGATDRQIRKQPGHKSIAEFHRYAREDQKDRQIAVSELGL